MFIKNLFLSSLLAASLAAAQTGKCSADNNTINGQGDIDNIATCSSLDGDVTIGKDCPSVKFENLRTIKGSFIAEDATKLSKIDMPRLETVNGSFKLQRLTSLVTLTAPAFTNVGDLDFLTLPMLQSFNMKITRANNVRISDTQITSLSGINVGSVTNFKVDNNKYLKSVTLSLKTANEDIVFESNSKQITIDFPALIWARNLTFIDVASISLPQLQHVNGSANFGNNSVTSIECKNLTEVEQTLAFVGNPKLTKLDFPELEIIGGGFKIHNNTELKTIDGFPKLKTVRGAVDFVGSFTNATLPALEDVQGSFNVQTTEELDCSAFNQLEGEAVKGDSFTCKGKQDDPKTLDGTSGGKGNGSGGKDNGNAAGRLTISALLGLSVAAIGFSL